MSGSLLDAFNSCSSIENMATRGRVGKAFLPYMAVVQTSKIFSESVGRDFDEILQGCSLGDFHWIPSTPVVRRLQIRAPTGQQHSFVEVDHSLPAADSRRAFVSFWRKNVHNTG